MKSKVRIVACADNFHFIKDLIPALSHEFDIATIKTINYSENQEEFNNTNLLWLEWADELPLQFLKYMNFGLGPVHENKKIILRLHRYELFTDRTIKNIAALSKESIDRIDRMVFVSKFVRRIGIDKFPWMINSTIIPNLIDHIKFPYSDREKGFNIMMLGRMSYVKNLPLALAMFHELLKIDSRYKLHIVGEIAEPELVYYIQNFIRKTGCENISFYGRIDNDKLPEFMKKMHYILCSSIFESFGMGIIEAMCCGLKPIVFNFPGAEYIFENQWRWSDTGEFIGIVQGGEYTPERYNQFVVENFSIEKNIHLYKELINGVLNEK